MARGDIENIVDPTDWYKTDKIEAKKLINDYEKFKLSGDSDNRLIGDPILNEIQKYQHLDFVVKFLDEELVGEIAKLDPRGQEVYDIITKPKSGIITEGNITRKFRGIVPYNVPFK